MWERASTGREDGSRGREWETERVLLPADATARPSCCDRAQRSTRPAAGKVMVAIIQMLCFFFFFVATTSIWGLAFLPQNLFSHLLYCFTVTDRLTGPVSGTEGLRLRLSVGLRSDPSGETLLIIIMGAPPNNPLSHRTVKLAGRRSLPARRTLS